MEDLPSPESIKPKMSSINNELHKILKALNTIQEQQLPLLDEKNVLQQQLKGKFRQSAMMHHGCTVKQYYLSVFAIITD